MTAPAVRVARVTKSLDGRRILDDVSLELNGGEIVGLLGPNGAGKTTLIRTIVGLLEPDAGDAIVEGDGSRRRGRHISYLPEERGLYARQPIGETLVYLATLRGIAEADARRAAHAWLARMDLADAIERHLGTLSKGQQQKVQFAAALMIDAPVLLLDEPFSGLDPLNVRLFAALVADARAAGKAVLLSAHQLHVLEPLCDRVAIVSGGRIVADASVSALRETYGGSLEHAFVSAVTKGGPQ
jgi:ABC-2 type transport system ATP-binding protein